MKKQKAIVKYQVITHTGTISVECDENDENELLIAKAKEIYRTLYGFPTVPMYYESWKVIDRDYY